MTDRIKKLHEKMIVDRKNPIGIEKYKIILETTREFQGWDRELVRAMTQKRILERMPIIIQEGELLVGNPASKRWGLEIDSELGLWDEEEIRALREDGYCLSDEDARLILEMNKEFRPFGMYEAANLAVRANKRLEDFSRCGIFIGEWKDEYNDRLGPTGNRLGGGSAASGLGLGPSWMLLAIDHNIPLQRGYKSLIEECEKELQEQHFENGDDYARSMGLQAMSICLQAGIDYAARCAEAAEAEAAKAKDPKRKQELLQMAEACRWVPANPPRNFREAMQFVWFIMLIITPGPTVPIGRFDQYMYPFYKKDKDAGLITDEEVLEYLEMFRINMTEIHQISGSAIRAQANGDARWYNMTIGGVKPDGSDASNELSYLVLDAVLDCRTIHHTVTIRVADSTPESLILKGLECQAKGCSMPAFANDKTFLKYFHNDYCNRKGLPLEDARDYCMCGCIDGNIPGRTATLSVAQFIVPLTLEAFLNHGYIASTGVHTGRDETGDLDQYADFDSFFNAYKEDLRYYLRCVAERNSIENIVFRDQSPYPFHSAFMKGGIKAGVDIWRRQLEFKNSSLINCVGVVNLAQSLFAIRELVYNRKLLKLSELNEILNADWESHEDLRKLALSIPQYGNDEDSVDSMVAGIYSFIGEATQQIPTSLGGFTANNCISISSHAPGGALTGATPDGRKAGEILADAAASPIRGRDVNGPLAVFRSAAKIDQSPFQAFLFNMKFSPSSLKTESDLKKLEAAIRVYFDCGGSMIQFNVVSADTLRAAQADPESHKDLMVRVAGYSAYYTNLSDVIQDEIIARTENEL